MRVALLVCQLTSATRQTSFEGFPVGVKSNGGFYAIPPPNPSMRPRSITEDPTATDRIMHVDRDPSIFPRARAGHNSVRCC